VSEERTSTHDKRMVEEIRGLVSYAFAKVAKERSAQSGSGNRGPSTPAARPPELGITKGQNLIQAFYLEWFMLFAWPGFEV
jgi:hypothetical protein